MKSTELRELYLNFFKAKGHTVIPSASLIPENDPTVLFTTAGMHPLVPYLVGGKHPMGNRLVNSQKCIRTDDIDEVGDKVHHTFFEMLGNWSLGDSASKDGIGTGYFKTEAIEMSFEFLTDKKWLGLDKAKLAFSVFAGDSDAPFDNEVYDKWLSLGIDADRIAKLPKKNNWWGPAGQTGPCGPDTEMFYWTGDIEAPKNFQDTCDDPNWVEIWNDVFMQYDKTQDVIYQPLVQKNVDTGMGLERMLAIINNLDDNYQTDLFWPIIQKIEQISGKKYPIDVIPIDSSSGHPVRHLHDQEISLRGESRPSQLILGSPSSPVIPSSPSLVIPTDSSPVIPTDSSPVIPTAVEESLTQESINTQKSFRIIADHIKAAVFAISDGGYPSNKGAGYVVRKLIRRAIVKADQLGIKDNFTATLAEVIFSIYSGLYYSSSESCGELVESIEKSVLSELEKEEQKFKKILDNSEKFLQKARPQIEKFIASGKRSEKDGSISRDLSYLGEIAFNLYQTEGIPPEISYKFFQNITSEPESWYQEFFEQAMREHQELSRTASAGMFKGGLADSSEQTTRLHTAAHLLLAALRQVLGTHVYQKGSNITAERLRFDFSNPEKMTPEQIKQVEDLVNEQIAKKLPVILEEVSLDEAKSQGAMGVFDSKYGDKVKVYTIGQVNNESSSSSEPPFSREICGGPHVQNLSELTHFKIQKEESSSSGVRRIKAILE